MSKENVVKREYYHGIREVTSGEERIVMFGTVAVSVPSGYAYCANSEDMAQGLIQSAFRATPIEDADTISISPYDIADIVMGLYTTVNPIFPDKKNRFFNDIFKYTDLYGTGNPDIEKYNLPRGNYTTVTQNRDIWVRYEPRIDGSAWIWVNFEVIVRDANAIYHGYFQVNSEIISDWEEKVKEMLGWINVADERIDNSHPLLFNTLLYKGISDKYDSFNSLQIPLLKGYAFDMSDCTDKNIKKRWKSLDDTDNSEGYGRYYAITHADKIAYSDNAPQSFLIAMKMTAEKTLFLTGKITSSMLALFTNPEVTLYDHDIGAIFTVFIFSEKGFYHIQLALRIRTPDPIPSIDEFKYDIVRIAREFAEKITVEGEDADAAAKTDISNQMSSVADAEPDWDDDEEMSEEELIVQFNLHPVELTKFNCTIEDGVFANYFGDESEIILPNGIHAIKEVSLSDNSFSAVVVPEGVTSIGFSAFSDCANLETVVLPRSLETIEDHAFECCTALKNINIPYGIETINESTFNECQNLETIDLPGSIKNIKKLAFSESGLISIVIPEGVEEIWEMAFYQCAKLESVSLPSTLKKIGDSAFFSCDSLSDLYVPSSVCEIDENGLGYPDDIIIHTPAGSFTDKYCRKNGYRVVNDI